jgi:hypothetical protein
MKLLLSLFMIKNILYNNISFITKINSNSNKLLHNLDYHKNTNLGNDERNEIYFTNDTCEIAKIARNMDILDRINKLKKIHNIHYEIENIKKINIKPGNIKSGLLSDW